MHTSQSRPNFTRNVLLLLILLPALCVTNLFPHPAAASDDSVGLKAEAVSSTSTGAPEQASQSHHAEAYGKLPMSFEVNEGQADRRVKFLSRGSGYSLFLTAAEAVLTLNAPAARETGTAPLTASSAVHRTSSAGQGRTRQDVLRMKLLGANSSARATGLEELPGKSNYFIGDDPRQWHTNVAHYSRVRYEAVYRGVDLVFYGNQRQVEYDFIVAPGADPSAIGLAFEGARSVRIDACGDLVLRTRGGEVRQRKPLVYQETGGQRQEVAGRYVKKGKRQVGFEVGEYDPSRPLVIDPVLIYTTFLGGSADDEIKGIATDGAGNAYVVGHTASANFPATGGTFQTVLGGGSDAFVTKLDSSGSVLLYSTYLGGSSFERSAGIAVDSAGNAYLTGLTSSNNFPVTAGAFDPFYNSASDAFVTKLGPTGASLVYSTYLGGSSSEEPFGIAIDAAGGAYVTGITYSLDFPVTFGAGDTTFNGNFDGFVTRVNTSGTGLVYSTFFGGNGSDYITGIAVSAGSGIAYLVGATSSTNFPVTPGAFDTSLGGGFDAFAAKLNATGNGLYYSTFLGGGGSEVGFGIAVDGAGYAYVTGYSPASGFPVTFGAFDTSYNGLSDAFVTKLNQSGTGLIYSTYLGGSGNELGYGIAVDGTGQAYVTGYSNSANFPTTPGALDTTYAGGGVPASDAFVAKLSQSGAALAYSTYYGGGAGLDEGRSIAVDTAGNVYVGGVTGSTDFAPTPGAFDTTFNGGVYDGFVLKLQFP